MWTDRQTDMTKLIVAFRNFAKEPKKDCTGIQVEALAVFVFIEGFLSNSKKAEVEKFRWPSCSGTLSLQGCA
jgi:hypothetical protein